MDRNCPHDAAACPSHPTRKRRPHKKSRAGCGNCKRRRVKCDEQLPSCCNCISFSLRCDFNPASDPEPPSSEQSPQLGDPTSTRRRGRPRKDWANIPGNARPTSDSGSRSNQPSGPPRGDAEAGLPSAPSTSFDTDDMALFHHYLTDPILQQGDVSLWRDRVPVLAFSHPCVLQLLLAVSALHLARLRPQQASHFRQLAETRAAAGLRQTAQLLPRLSRENCSALYIAAILVVIFSLAKGPSLVDLFFVGHGGVEAPWWEPVRGVRLVFGTMGPGAIFSGVLAPPQGPSTSVPAETPAPVGASLGRVPSVALFWVEALREVSDLIAASSACPDTDMFQRMLDGLADCFRETFGTREEPRDGGTLGKFEVVMAWVYRLDDGFTPQVSRRNPVALVLLAHFAVLLQTMEHAWFMEGWAGHILQRAVEMLGLRYAEWLRWPTGTIAALAAQGNCLATKDA